MLLLLFKLVCFSDALADLPSAEFNYYDGPSGYDALPFHPESASGASKGVKDILSSPPGKSYDHIRHKANQVADLSRQAEAKIAQVKSIPKSSKISFDDIFASALEEQIGRVDLYSTGKFRARLDKTLNNFNNLNGLASNRQMAKDLGLVAIKDADVSYLSNKMEDANHFADLAEGFLDIAVGFDPVTGTARSTYELFTGKNLITGANLTTIERSLAFVGVVSLGTGNTAIKAATSFNRIMKGASHLVKNRHALETAITAGVGMASKVEHLLGGMKKGFVITSIDKAETLNALYPKPAFLLKSHIVNFLTTKETKFARVFTEGTTRVESRWMVKSGEIKGLTPHEIRTKLNLPYEPTHIVDVYVSQNSKMARGMTQFNQWDQFISHSEGQVQYLLMEGVEKASFKNVRKIGDKL